jgi:hypothetical protein
MSCLAHITTYLPCLQSSRGIVDIGLPGSNALWTCRRIQTFRRNVQSPFSSPEDGDTMFLETLVVPTSPRSVTAANAII